MKIKTLLLLISLNFAFFSLSSFSQSNRLWATYYGGSGSELYSYGVSTDALGNVYLAGATTSTVNIASGGFQNIIGGGTDAYLTKFDAAGNLLWSTYYGGTSSDYGGSIATDVLGNVYLSGYTYSSSNIASGGFQNSFGGFTDVFLVKFDASGNRLWATYYGGTNEDYSGGIAIDGVGNVYLAGNTSSTTNIAFSGFDNIYSGGASYFGDSFLVKFDGNGNRIWATYYGGTGDEFGSSVAIDASDNVCLAGNTTSSSDIASGGFQNAYGGGIIVGGDAFLVKFTPSGARLWATYYGGPDNDGGKVCTDNSGYIYIAGATGNVTATGMAFGGFQNISGGGDDAFLVKFDASGNRLWATYYGGTGSDLGYNAATDMWGNVYLAGETYSSNSIASGGFQNTKSGGKDAFLVKFDTNGNRLEATYYGKSGGEEKANIATDASGNVFLAGYTTSTISIASGGFQNAYGGGTYDAYLVKFTSGVNPLIANVTSTSIDCNGPCNGTGKITAFGGTNPYSYSWNTGQTSQTITGLCLGTYTVIVTDAASAAFVVAINITQLPVLTASVTTNGSSATANVSGGAAPYFYLWSNGVTKQSVSNLANGTYTCTVTDNNGCIAQTFAVISGLGIETVNNIIQMHVFPNPNSGTFSINIETKDNSPLKLIVTNLLGELVEQRVINNTGLQIVQVNFKNYSKGFYFVNINQGEIHKITKVIVE